ncbi:MAG TPA: CCA tRNA nucleotidyltransferase [Gemmatimonadales bacterium]
MGDPDAGHREPGADLLRQRVDLPAEVVAIAQRLEDAGFETWAVGGALRDLLLDEGGSDVDLATAAPPEVVQRLFRHTVPVGLAHGTVGVLDPDRRLHEVTTFRHDVATDGRHAIVQFGASLHDDLARRDFTINAIAYHPIRKEWADPFRGYADLRAGVVRAVGNPAERFREDYLRILRAIRFAARFDFEIEPVTWSAAVAAASGLSGLSAERVRDEWFKSLGSARSLPRLVRLWHEAGAARSWLPELHPDWPGADIAPAERDPVLLTAVAGSAPDVALRRLRASNAEIARAEAIVAGPAAPASQDPSPVRRWLARVGDAADDLLRVHRYLRGEDPPWAGVVSGIRARGEATTRAGLALTGSDLLELGLPAGPELGAMLDRLLGAVLDDPGLNTRERLLEMARSWR